VPEEAEEMTNAAEPADGAVVVSRNSRNGFRFSINWPAVAGICSILGIVIFCAGWIFGYTTFKADLRIVVENVSTIRDENKAMQDRINIMARTITDDRSISDHRLTTVETQMLAIAQGIARLEVAIGTKR
jgi:hypothetical protein